jgi:hypothetical protein
MGHLILGAVGNVLRLTVLLRFGTKLPNKCEYFLNRKMTFSFTKFTIDIIKKDELIFQHVFSISLRISYNTISSIP